MNARWTWRQYIAMSDILIGIWIGLYPRVGIRGPSWEILDDNVPSFVCPSLRENFVRWNLLSPWSILLVEFLRSSWTCGETSWHINQLSKYLRKPVMLIQRSRFPHHIPSALLRRPTTFKSRLSIHGNRFASNEPEFADSVLSRTRNIGIIAHIDAVRFKLFSTFAQGLTVTGKNNDYGAYALLQWSY